MFRQMLVMSIPARVQMKPRLKAWFTGAFPFSHKKAQKAHKN